MDERKQDLIFLTSWLKQEPMQAKAPFSLQLCIYFKGICPEDCGYVPHLRFLRGYLFSGSWQILLEPLNASSPSVEANIPKTR